MANFLYKFLKYRMDNLSILTVSVFDTNGVWIKPTNVRAVDILIIGGGGGGGGGGMRTGAFGSFASGGNGGNPGNVFFLKKYMSSLLETSINVTIGIGGLGCTGAPGITSASLFQGGTGGTSSFDSFIALGGYGGRVGTVGYPTTINT